mmetsp:Transcript_29106/g.56265  ORF Transcript_29106/g.56265 Transcript_29106/m.56265 type:complete len:91 (+) Transcript_29106:57-329(+)
MLLAKPNETCITQEDYAPVLLILALRGVAESENNKLEDDPQHSQQQRPQRQLPMNVRMATAMPSFGVRLKFLCEAHQLPLCLFVSDFAPP